MWYKYLVEAPVETVQTRNFCGEVSKIFSRHRSQLHPTEAQQQQVKPIDVNSVIATVFPKEYKYSSFIEIGPWEVIHQGPPKKFSTNEVR
jgi:hypothetical protein